MSDWIDHLTKDEAKAIVDAPIRTRYAACDDLGRPVTRYVAPTAAELARIKAKAND